MKRLSKKGISTEVLVIILLIVALATISVLWLLWSTRGQGLLQGLSDLFML